ncbi:MFS transporter [Pedobacter sp.]|uniref:MFS transporter n=1 Tax=Pedobacter sp. TaxID=1411316 RepID=UPI00396CDF9E
MKSMFRSFNYYNYRLHFTGQSISLIGTWMQRVAVSWLVYRITGSAFMLGLISFLALIPALLLGPIAGNFVDKRNKYKTVLVCQVIFMLQAGVLALLVWLKHYNITLIAILSLIQGIVATFETTARQSLVVEFVDNKDDLSNAVALNSSAFNAARLIGPALAGIILSTYGEDACFILNFLSFIPVIICLLLMKLNLKSNNVLNEDIWTGLKKGYHYLEDSPDISSLIIVLAFSSLLVIPFSTLLPVFAKTVFNGNATTFSWFESAGGLGALLGAIYMASLKSGKDLSRIVILSAIIFGAGLILLSAAPTVWLALISTSLACIGMMMLTSAINTYIQTHSANELRGRAISYYLMAYQGILPIGTLAIGYFAHVLSAKTIVLIEGILAFIIIVCYYFYNQGKKYNQLQD